MIVNDSFSVYNLTLFLNKLNFILHFVLEQVKFYPENITTSIVWEWPD